MLAVALAAEARVARAIVVARLGGKAGKNDRYARREIVSWKKFTLARSAINAVACAT